MKKKVDESYFGGRRKGKRGRGAVVKVPVLCLLKRTGQVHVMIVPSTSTEKLFPIIQEKIKPHSIIYTDSFQAYDLLDVLEFHHVRINHSELFADQDNYINGI